MAQKSSARSALRWHAVAIKPTGTSCEAARACRAARFLASEAPRLPLVECTTSDACTCTYKHLPDRRVNSRRQGDGGGLKRSNKVGQERRKEGDRRKGDPD
jgi:hypothetical protein